MIGAAILQCGTLLIGYMGTPAQVTYFNAAFRIYSSVRQIIGWLTDPFRPVLSRLFVRDHARAGTVLYDLLFVAFITSTTGCVFLILSLPVLLRIWLGDEAPLGEVQSAASILLAGLILNAIHIPLIPASDAAGRPGAFLPHQTAWLISYTVLSLILFPHFGITGVALAMTLPLPVIELAYLIRAQSTVGLAGQLWHKRVIRPSIPVLIAGLLAALSIAAWPSDPYVIIASFGFVGVTVLTLFVSRTQWSYKSILTSLRLES
jgi:O-antigen/teichoic acid export membrane protein